MKIIVQPVKGSYKLLFYDGKHVLGVGIAEMTDTPKGPRPVRYPAPLGIAQGYRVTPSKDLIAQLREGDVRMVRHDPLVRGVPALVPDPDRHRRCLPDMPAR